MGNLFSEEVERSKRFKLSLKISLPLVLVLGLLILLMFSKDDFVWQDLFLLVILVACYVYYVVYFIYFAFKNTTIDAVSGVFTRKEITDLIKKELQSQSGKSIALVSLTNIQDVNFRYGYKNGDKLLRDFVLQLSNYFGDSGFKHIPIGRYSGGSFLFLIDCKISQLNHLLKTFERKVSNNGINNIEVKINFATIEANYDKDIDNITNYLFSKILYDEKDVEENKVDVIKPDVLDELVKYAIDNSEFELKKQTIKSLKDKKDLQNLAITLNLKDAGSVTKLKVMEITTRNNYEIKYDLKVIEFIAKTFDFENFDSRVFIEISPVSLRNHDFKNEIHRMITNKIINPNKIVFEFYEKEPYDEMIRFAEIITQFKEYGFKIAINQFLGNNASFEYFKYLDVDYVIYDLEINKKIDEPKIGEIFNITNKNLVKFNIETMVRFVDKAKFYEEVKTRGVDYAQGFYIDKPTKI
ncbi:MAG: GGDEF domain-containing protein [Campylobacteraceae bacterium]|nr:GGDEF domain-containing protein [Campylobacteraceae bacterium]